MIILIITISKEKNPISITHILKKNDYTHNNSNNNYNEWREYTHVAQTKSEQT